MNTNTLNRLISNVREAFKTELIYDRAHSCKSTIPTML